MLKIISVFGTRPEAIKMAPILQELCRHPGKIQSVVCVTAQHRQMLDQVLELFALRPNYDLNVMQDSQSPAQVAAAVLTKLEPVLQQEKPDWVLVQGDTTTVAAAALGAFYARTRVGHVEAGLRTYDKCQPFPEEVNRKVADVIADLYFAPTTDSRDNLLREGLPAAQIHVTGNTSIDALLQMAAREYDWASGPLATLPTDKRLILVTAHRHENFGQPLQDMCAALRTLAEHYAGDVHFVYPVHRNPNVMNTVYPALGGLPNFTLLGPLEYLPLVQLMKRCALVLTDSGGIQEEAPSLGVPVLVMREATERPEGVAAGTARIVGTDTQRIIAETRRLLDDPAAHAQMARAINPYGDGRAAERIVQALLATL